MDEDAGGADRNLARGIVGDLELVEPGVVQAQPTGPRAAVDPANRVVTDVRAAFRRAADGVREHTRPGWLVNERRRGNRYIDEVD